MATEKDAGCNGQELPAAETLAEENARLRQRIAELEAMATPCATHKEVADRTTHECIAGAPGCHLQEMADNVRDVFWIFDWVGQKVIYVSPAYAAIWGRSVQALYERYEEWGDSIHPEDREFATASLGKAVQTGGGEPREYRIVRPDGTVRWVSDRAYAVRDANGSVCRVAGVAKDITERKQAEQALRESQVRLQAAVESLPFDFFMVDTDGYYAMFNSVAREHWGDHTGRRPEDLCPDEATCELWRSNNARAFAGEVVKGEVELAPGGKPGYYYNIISPVRDGDAIRGILGVNIDITAQKQAEADLRRTKDDLEQRVRERTAELEAEIERRTQAELELRESEEKYRTLVENSGHAIAAINEAGEYLFANQTTADYFSLAPQEMIGRTIWDFFPSDVADEHMNHIRTVIQTRVGSTLTTPSKIGRQTLWFTATAEPLEIGGKVEAALVIARDVTELALAKKQVEEYREQMTRADRLASLGTMSAMVSHELTQPLTVMRLSIQNALEAIKAGAPSSSVADDLKGCVDEVTTMTGIVERFRGFARASSPGQHFDVDLSVIARHMVDLTALAAERARVSVSLQGFDGLPAFSARAKDMEQVFFALLMNAIQAADGTRDRTIAVRGQVRDRDIELLFEDDCGGIAPEHVGLVFKPFFTTKGNAGGTGLGLCVVEHILDRYDAKIQVHNRPDEGVTFKVTLPVSTTC